MIRLQRSVAGVLMLGLVVASCATRSVSSIGAGGRPFRPEADERKLWAQAEHEEENLLKRVNTYDDPLLERYLGQIAEKLAARDVAVAGPLIRFVVLRDPTLNAFAMPDGRVFVHTGVLSRLENEAQLATVVGHELAHVYHRDALRFSRHRDSNPIVSRVREMVATSAVRPNSPVRKDEYVGGAVLSPTANAILGLELNVATIAAINGYGVDLEREADTAGLRELVRAGYDPKESLKLLTSLRTEAAARGPLETFVVGNPARLQERIDVIQPLILKRYAEASKRADTVKNTDEFDQRMRAVVRDNAALDIQAGRFPLAARQLDRVIKASPDDAVAHLYYGDLYRLQAQRGRTADERNADALKAEASYEKAVTLDASYAEPFRQLGLLYYQQKNPGRAREAFEKYLALKPDAPDARRVKEYLGELSR